MSDAPPASGGPGDDEPLPPDAELAFRASRSGGPGGQHANKTASRVEVIWNLDASSAVTPAQRARLRQRLRSRLRGGELVVACDSDRSQHRNRALATERLRQMVAQALVVSKRRKKTRPSRASKERRLESKRRRAARKANRRAPDY